STLISRLFTRVAHVLRRGELAGSDTSEVAADKIDAVKAALSEYPPTRLERHLADMPRAWLLSQSVRGLIDQSLQMLEFRREEDKVDMDAIAEDARMALRGRLSLDARHAELRRSQPEGILHERRPEPEITVDDDASDFFTVVEVRASDRVGLLYTITRALVEM